MLVISLKRSIDAATIRDPSPVQRRVGQWLRFGMTLSVRNLRPLFAASSPSAEANP